MMSSAVPASVPDRLNILLVEDNRGDVILMRRALRQVDAGITVTAAGSAEEALELLQDSSLAAFDLMLLDLNLPHMSGIDLLSQLKKAAYLQHIPVLILSSSEAANDVSRSYELAASAYIVKPLSIDGYDKLAEFIHDCWFGGNAVPIDLGDGRVLKFGT